MSQDATLELPRPAPERLRGSQIVLVFIAVAAATFLAGIGTAVMSRPAVDDTVVARERIGPGGGTIRFDDGQVVVPDGALNGTVEIVVRRSPVRDRLRVLLRDDPVVIEPGQLFAYRFEPVNVIFAEPVEVTFRLPDGARNATVFVRHGDEIDPLRGTIDVARETATITVRDFDLDD